MESRYNDDLRFRQQMVPSDLISICLWYDWALCRLVTEAVGMDILPILRIWSPLESALGVCPSELTIAWWALVILNNNSIRERGRNVSGKLSCRWELKFKYFLVRHLGKEGESFGDCKSCIIVYWTWRRVKKGTYVGSWLVNMSEVSDWWWHGPDGGHCSQYQDNKGENQCPSWEEVCGDIWHCVKTGAVSRSWWPIIVGGLTQAWSLQIRWSAWEQYLSLLPQLMNFLVTLNNQTNQK